MELRHFCRANMNKMEGDWLAAGGFVECASVSLWAVRVAIDYSVGCLVNIKSVLWWTTLIQDENIAANKWVSDKNNRVGAISEIQPQLI